MLAIHLLGKITERDTSSPTGWRTVVYQRAPDFACNITLPNGERLQRRIIKQRTTQPSNAELSRRAHMKQAMAAWRDSSQVERAAYAIIADQRNILTHNAFISDWLLTNPAPTITTAQPAAYTKNTPHVIRTRAGKIRAKAP